MPKISIIIPIYNVEKYLRQCLDSCINQTLKDIEIICVNDGSTDNCLDIIKEYANKDSRIKLINQNNQGLAIARYNGFDIATGEYVLFLDPDDWITIDCCELAYNQAKENDNDFVWYTYYNYIENKEKYVINKLNIQKLAGIKSVNLNNIDDINYLQAAYVWNKIYKRKWLIENNIKFINMQWEDLPFTAQAIINSKSISIINKPLYFYRDRERSLTKQVSIDAIIKSKDIALRYILNTCNNKLLKVYLSYYFISLLHWYDNFPMNKKQKLEYEKLMFESFEQVKDIDYRATLYKILIKTKIYIIIKILKKIIRIIKWICRKIIMFFNKKEN